MSAAARLLLDTRYDQMSPRLEGAELDPLRRFGAARSHAAGAYLAGTGEAKAGMFAVLYGEIVDVSRRIAPRNGPIPRYFCLLSAKLIKNAQLKIIKGAPHRMRSTPKDQINEELLSFFKS